MNHHEELRILRQRRRQIAAGIRNTTGHQRASLVASYEAAMRAENRHKIAIEFDL
ncbi:hypothetical protein [Rhodococcus ruber]|uniref:hypothetical protein n=1 Tax=Rhodococcus ruber TaxID=1830 RepID=UPI0037849329